MDFKTLKEAGDAYDKLQNSNDAQALEIASKVNTIDNLNGELVILRDINRHQAEEVNNQVDEIAELNHLISELRTAKPSFGQQPGFVHEKTGKTYEITAGKVKYKDKEYSAAEIMDNKDLQEEFINIGAGFIVEKTEQ